jgi:hypothetical protein
MTVMRLRLEGGDAELGQVAEAFWRSKSFAMLQLAQRTTGHIDPAARS